MSFPKGTKFPNGIRPYVMTGNNPYTIHIGFVTITFASAPEYPEGSIPIDLPFLKTEEGFSLTLSVFSFLTLKLWIH